MRRKILSFFLSFIMLMSTMVDFVAYADGQNVEISSQPQDVTCVVGETVSVNVGVTGDVSSYKWQTKKVGATKWSNSTNATARTDTFAFTIVNSHDGMQLRCVVTGENGEVLTSNIATIHVVDEILPTSIILSETELELYIDDTVELEATLIPENVTENTVRWSSSNDDIATVDESGFVTAISGGTATITATTVNGLTATCLVTVEAFEITSQPQDVTCVVGETVSVSVGVTGEVSSYKWQTMAKGKTKWSNSTNATARTDTFTFTAGSSHDGMKVKCIVTGENGEVLTSNIATIHVITRIPPSSITLSETEIEMYTDDTVELTATLMPENVTETAVTWSSSDDTVATVDANGFVTAISGGTATITAATVNGLTATCLVTVKAFEITSQPQDVTCVVGEAISVSVGVTGDVSSYKWQTKKVGATKWSNSTNATARTDTFTFTIVNSHDGMQLRCIVTGENGEVLTSNIATIHVITRIPPSSITLSETEIEMYTDDTVELTATLMPENVTETAVTWSSSDDTVATVDANGFVTAISGGTATITAATVNGLTATCLVTVKAFEITSQPQDVTCVVGEAISVSVGVTGDVSSYKWQTKKVGATKWSNSTNATARTDTFTFTIVNSHDGMQVRCIVTGENGEVLTSDIATIHVISQIKVNYDANGGLFEDGTDIHNMPPRDPGEYVIAHERPTREGYVFAGWTVNGQPVQRIDLTEDVTVTAIWNRIWTVTYDANGGSWGTDENGQPVTSRSVQAMGNKYYYLDSVNVPARTGYVFLGWTINNRYVEKKLIVADTTATAQWAQAATVTYLASGGFWTDRQTGQTFDSYDSTEAAGTYYIGGRVPTREGYDFNGWLVDGQYVEKVTLAVGDHLYVDAAWQKIVQVAYDPNGGSWGEETQARVSDERTGSYHVGMEWPQRDGYTFLGWATTSTAADYAAVQTDYEYDLQANTTFYAVWHPLLTVTYDADGGLIDFNGSHTETITQTAEYGRDYRVGNFWAFRELPYEFLGWTMDEDPTEDSTLVGGTHMILTEDTTFRAVWRQQATITYHANGGSWGTDDQNSPVTERTQYQKMGRTYYVGEWEPNRDGWQFDGWYDAAENGNRVDEDAGIVIDQLNYDFYAGWRKEVTVTYVTSIGGWDDGSSVQTSFQRNEWSGDYEVDGWRPNTDDSSKWFLGYTTVQGGTTATIQPEEHIQLPETGLTLYAVWRDRPVVTYDANGGFFGRDQYNQPITTQSHMVDPGCTYHVGWGNPMNEEGYRFLGWSADPNAAEGSFSIETVINDDTSFYAVWENLIGITYDANGGVYRDGSDKHTFYYHVGESVRIGHEMPTLSGCEFDGWMDEEGEFPSRIEITAGMGDITMTAQWCYTVTYDANGGSWNDGNTRIVRESGGLYYIGMEPPARSGYNFLGWTVDDEYVDSIWVDQSIEVMAAWEPDGTHQEICQVLFNANGGVLTDTDGVSPIPNCEVADGYPQEYAVPYEQGTGTPVLCAKRDGYSFAGWSLADGSVVQMGESFTVSGEEMTLTAVWEENTVEPAVPTAVYIISPNHTSFTLDPDPVNYPSYFTAESVVEGVSDTDALTYVWEVCEQNEEIWTEIENLSENDASLLTTITEPGTYLYRVTVNGVTSSNTLQVYAEFNPTAGEVEIWTDADWVSVGEEFMIESAVTDFDALTYIWYRSADGGITWEEVSSWNTSDDSSVFVISEDTTGAYSYKLMVLDVSGVGIVSNIVTITCEPAAPEVCTECGGLDGEHEVWCTVNGGCGHENYCDECGGTYGEHYPGCSQYVDPNPPAVCDECGGMDGEHAPWCTVNGGCGHENYCDECGGTYGVHYPGCSLYIEPGPDETEPVV